MTSIKRTSQLNLRLSFESNPRPIKWKNALNTKSILCSFKFINIQSIIQLHFSTRLKAQRLVQLKVLQFRANLQHSDIFADLFTWMCATYGLVVVAVLCSCTNLVFSSVFFTKKPNFAPTHLSQLDQRVLLYLARHQLVLSF